MKIILISLFILVSTCIQAQQHVKIYVQDYETDHGSLYWDMKYGLKTWLNESPVWIEYNKGYYSLELDAYIECELVSTPNWMDTTISIINRLERGGDTLFVYVGHNALLDTLLTRRYDNCSPSLLFGCMTYNWPVDNCWLVTTDLISPEAYVTLPSIEMYLEGYDEVEIAGYAAQQYSKFQNIAYKRAAKIFNAQ